MPHLRERASTPGDRALHDGLLDDDRRDRRDAERSGRPPSTSRSRNPCPRVPEREHDGAHREVDLSRERDRRERERRPDEAPPLEREQRRGEEERDQSEQVPGRLSRPGRAPARRRGRPRAPPARRGRARAATSRRARRPPTNESSTTRSYAQTFPKSALSGQKGIPSSQPCRFGDAPASGRNEYGSAHGAAPRARAGDPGARTPNRAGGGLRPRPRRSPEPAGPGSGRRRGAPRARSPRARRRRRALARERRSGRDHRVDVRHLPLAAATRP